MKKQSWPAMILLSLSVGSIALVSVIMGSLVYTDYRMALRAEAEQLRSISQSVATYAQCLLVSLELAMEYMDAWITREPAIRSTVRP